MEQFEAWFNYWFVKPVVFVNVSELEKCLQQEEKARQKKLNQVRLAERRIRLAAAKARMAAARKARMRETALRKRMAKSEEERMRDRMQHRINLCKKNVAESITVNLFKAQLEFENAKFENKNKSKEAVKAKETEENAMEEAPEVIPQEAELEVAVKSILKVDNSKIN
uniref:Uncharacterized protein n=1 Tax=Caenorhabditis tropicalis TaxID=1561998 RepID=A0A1I7V2X1_9PELO